MRKGQKCSTKKCWNYITVDYNPKAPLEDRVQALADCMQYLAKSILSLQGAFDKYTKSNDEVVSALVEATTNLIDDVTNAQEDIADLQEEINY